MLRTWFLVWCYQEVVELQWELLRSLGPLESTSHMSSCERVVIKTWVLSLLTVSWLTHDPSFAPALPSAILHRPFTRSKACVMPLDLESVNQYIFSLSNWLSQIFCCSSKLMTTNTSLYSHIKLKIKPNR